MSSVVTLSFLKAENDLIKFFKDKGAISPNQAVQFNQEEFEKSGYFYLKSNTDLSKISYLKVTHDGKYYLDEKVLEQNVKNNKKLGFYLIAIVIFLIVFYLSLRFFS